MSPTTVFFFSLPYDFVGAQAHHNIEAEQTQYTPFKNADDARRCLMADTFCGIPYTRPNHWELQIPPWPCEGTDCKSSNALHYDVTPQLESLDFYVDVYNDHHACCWPRTLLDTHIGLASEAVARASESEPAAKTACYTCPSSNEGDCAGRGDGREHAKTLSELDVQIQHVHHIAEQLFTAQRERRPRASQARRIVYHNALPPVLRCSERGKSPVYFLKGQLGLCHRCRCSPENLADEGVAGGQRSGGVCTHAQQADALARDTFPPFCVMAPSVECAEFVDSEAGSATEASSWRSQPMMLALESVTQIHSTPLQGGQTSQQEDFTGDSFLWRATYSPFTWVCSPLGNRHMSSLVRSNAAAARVPRSRALARPPSRVGASTAMTSPPNSSPGCERDGMAAPQDCCGDLPPLQIAFDLYGTAYTSAAAKQHILDGLMTCHLFTPHMTQVRRFGFGDSAGVNGDASEVTEKQLLLSRACRPAQLMRLLETTLNVAMPSTATDASIGGLGPHCATLGGEAEGGTGRGRDADGPASISEHADDHLPPHKVSRLTADEAVATLREPLPQASVAQEPCVRTRLLGRLQTREPIARELCALPKSTALVSVMPKVSQSGHAEQPNNDDEGSGREQPSKKDCWPLRISLGDASGEKTVVELSKLSTLRDLASALRFVS